MLTSGQSKNYIYFHIHAQVVIVTFDIDMWWHVAIQGFYLSQILDKCASLEQQSCEKARQSPDVLQPCKSSNVHGIPQDTVLFCHC